MSSRTKSNVADVTMRQPTGGSGMATLTKMCWRCAKAKYPKPGARVLRGLWHCTECAQEMKASEAARAAKGQP